MGQSISTAIKSIDGGDASARETRDTLNSLYALGQSRVDAAYAEAMSDRGKMYAPISKVIVRRQSIVCKTSTDVKGITDGIQESFGNLISGQVLTGVVDLLKNALNIVLGQSAGQIASTYTYALIATELGAFLRIDIDVYNFALESQGLQSKVQNMTAISSIVSSVDPNALNAGDIRAIISVTFGGPGTKNDNAKAILDVVMSAWELDKKKSADQEVTGDDLAAHKALFLPSPYEAAAAASRASVGRQSHPPSKIDRETLVRKFRQRKPVEKDPTGDPPAPVNWQPLAIQIGLSNPADAEFLQRLVYALRGFREADIFEVQEYQDAISGNAVSINCEINAGGDSELFDIAVSYIEDTIFPALSSAGYLNRWIGSLAMQYKHPSQDGKGLPTHAAFSRNLMTNYSHHKITFYEAGTRNKLLELAPASGETLSSGILTGLVDYLVGTLTSIEDEDDTGGESEDNEIPTQWVTYESIDADTILTGMAISISDIEAGGFVLRFTDKNNRPTEVRYSVGWEGTS